MTEPERDAEISRRYRALDREEPPRALDEAIISAAHGAVETHPAPLVAPTARRRWYVPLAAVAVIVLSVVVTLQMQREQSDGEFMPLPPPSPPASPKEAAPAAPPASRDASVPRRAPGTMKAKERPMAPEPKPAGSAVPQQPAAPVPQAPLEKPFSAADESAGPAAAAVGRLAPMPEERGASRQSIEADRPGRMAADALQKRAEQAESPERWLDRIVALRREGRHKEADEAYAEFKRRYPEYRIPDAMRKHVLPR